MRLPALALALAVLAACSGGAPSLSLDDELAFRQLRQDFHVARTTGDYDLMRSLWADDAVLTTADGKTYVGGDAIAAFLASDPSFGTILALTLESRWILDVEGGVAEYGFESVGVDVGGNDPMHTPLSTDTGQNPDVQIVEHTNGTGLASRTADGHWVFVEFTAAEGPLPPSAVEQDRSVGTAPAAGGGGGSPHQASPMAQTQTPAAGDELGFLRMRETFHRANTTGDAELMRTVWAEDAVFRGGGNEYVGRDAIVAFFASTPGFGRTLNLTPESSQRLRIEGGFADYAFECIAIDVGGVDPLSAVLCMAGGTQNPDVQIARHTHSMGRAKRIADGRWVFQEFNGGLGPLPPE